MKLFFKLLLIIPFVIEANTVFQDDCSTKKKQIMRPSYPMGIGSTEGYAVVKYDIKKNGTVKNVKVIESQCIVVDLLADDDEKQDDKEIVYKSCPYFKSSAIGAMLYFKFKPPLNSKGQSCTIKDQEHKFTFTAYSKSKSKDE